ncbi:MAG: hypothetical protein NTW28_10985 [Candidatus Solibacter sp.]|nr:hypothetical protein [Candidatus Solibacter sp.]
MPKRGGLLLFVGFAALFLTVNRDAYRGYFQDDEIDNLSWAPYLGPLDYLKGVATPRFQVNNFRPVGHYYFHAVEEIAGLEFPVYVAVLHGFHLLNVWLLWLVARRLGATAFAAAAACLFFGVHMALFDNFWKPMYVFDVLCATFCLLSLWCYASERWVLSFVAFWLAYKSKELAVMLPVVLLAFEVWFGKRRWKVLAPFFLTSLSFGVQGILGNPNKDNDYTFRFTAAALAKTSGFYAGRILLIPYLGLVVPAFVFLTRNRRLWFGLAAMGLFFLPVLFLPGRVFSAYCYLPFTGLAIAITGLAEAVSPAALGLFLALWLPMDIHELRLRRRETLANGGEVRTWMSTVRRFAAGKERVDAFVFSGTPAGFHQWGVEGALKYFYERSDLTVKHTGEPGATALTQTRRVALLNWDASRKRLDIVMRGPGASE